MMAGNLVAKVSADCEPVQPGRVCRSRKLDLRDGLAWLCSIITEDICVVPSLHWL